MAAGISQNATTRKLLRRCIKIWLHYLRLGQNSECLSRNRKTFLHVGHVRWTTRSWLISLFFDLSRNVHLSQWYSPALSWTFYCHNKMKEDRSQEVLGSLQIHRKVFWLFKNKDTSRTSMCLLTDQAFENVFLQCGQVLLGLLSDFLNSLPRWAFFCSEEDPFSWVVSRFLLVLSLLKWDATDWTSGSDPNEDRLLSPSCASSIWECFDRFTSDPNFLLSPIPLLESSFWCRVIFVRKSSTQNWSWKRFPNRKLGGEKDKNN